MITTSFIDPKIEEQEIISILKSNSKSSLWLSGASLVFSLLAVVFSGFAVYYAHYDHRDDAEWKDMQETKYNEILAAQDSIFNALNIIQVNQLTELNLAPMTELHAESNTLLKAINHNITMIDQVKD